MNPDVGGERVPVISGRSTCIGDEVMHGLGNSETVSQAHSCKTFVDNKSMLRLVKATLTTSGIFSSPTRMPMINYAKCPPAK
jgi:hypothetical protein